VLHAAISLADFYLLGKAAPVLGKIRRNVLAGMARAANDMEVKRETYLPSYSKYASTRRATNQRKRKLHVTEKLPARYDLLFPDAYRGCMRTLCLFFVLVIVPVDSFAAGEGVVLIDQNRALTGSVTPGDMPGFPVTISEPGSYRLSGNLSISDPDATAIQITADSVTLDLNGFSIIGPAVCVAGPATICPTAGKGVGVQSVGAPLLGPQGVKVFNGSVRGMGIGISITGGGSRVEKVTADSNSAGGITAGSVSDSVITRNGAFGVIAQMVRDTLAGLNAGDGIILGAGGVASGNVASENGGVGIFVPYGTATANTVFLNKGAGISAICPSTIVNNTVISTEAVSIEAGSSCILANNATRQ
jgi:hypothetical protein